MKCSRPRCKRSRRRNGLCMAHWRNSVAAGVNGFTDAGPVAAHVQALLDLRWPYDGIARAAGVSATAVSDPFARSKIRRSTARAILAVPLVPYTGPYMAVSSVGLARRREALALQGWSLNVLAPMAGTSCQALCNAMANGKVSLRLHDAFAAVYDELVHRQGPSKWMVSWARKQGFYPAIAWEYADIDDPKAKPFQGFHEKRTA